MHAAFVSLVVVGLATWVAFASGLLELKVEVVVFVVVLELLVDALLVVLVPLSLA